MIRLFVNATATLTQFCAGHVPSLNPYSTYLGRGWCRWECIVEDASLLREVARFVLNIALYNKKRQALYLSFAPIPLQVWFAGVLRLLGI